MFLNGQWAETPISLRKFTVLHYIMLTNTLFPYLTELSKINKISWKSHMKQFTEWDNFCWYRLLFENKFGFPLVKSLISNDGQCTLLEIVKCSTRKFPELQNSFLHRWLKKKRLRQDLNPRSMDWSIKTLFPLSYPISAPFYIKCSTKSIGLCRYIINKCTRFKNNRVICSNVIMRQTDIQKTGSSKNLEIV